MLRSGTVLSGMSMTLGALLFFGGSWIYLDILAFDLRFVFHVPEEERLFVLKIARFTMA